MSEEFIFFEQWRRRGLWRLALVLAVLLLSFGVVLAICTVEVSTAFAADNEGAANTSLVQRQHPVTTIHNRYLIAKAQFELSGTEENRDVLRTRLEQLVAVLCMPHVHHLGPHSPEENSADCKEATDELLEISPNNALALCAQHGYEAAACIDAYELQYIETGQRRRGASAPPVSREFYSELERLRRSLPNDAIGESSNGELIEAFNALFATPLGESCENISVDYTKRPRVARGGSMGPTREEIAKTREQDAARQRVEDYVRERLGQEFAPIGASGPSEEELSPVALSETTLMRRRRIPHHCQLLLERLFEVHPRSALGMCYRHGWYSPACLQHLAAERAIMRRQRPAGGSLRRHRTTPALPETTVERF